MRDAQPHFNAFIRLHNGQITFRKDAEGVCFQPEDIVMLGEFSAPRGAYDADYFFVFKIKGMDKMVEVPAYSDGLFELIADLKQLLPGLSNPRLQMSEDFTSNVMYPKSLHGQPIYDFRAEVKPWINFPMLRNLVWVETMVKEINPELTI